MDGTARFLLGGAIGAALGYLLSQKNLQKATLQGAPDAAGIVPVSEAPVYIPTREAAPVAAGSVAPVLSPEAPSVAAPVVESPYEPPTVEFPSGPTETESPFEPPVVEAPVVRLSVVEAPVLEPPVVEAPVVDLPVVEPPLAELPVVEPPAMDAPAELTLVEALVTEEAPALEAPPAPTPWWESKPDSAGDATLDAPVVELPVVEAPVVDAPIVDLPVVDAPASAADTVEIEETEITFTKAFIDEPPTMPGWTSTAPVVDEEDIDVVLPAVPHQFPTMEAAEIERAQVVQRTDWSGPSRSEQVAEVAEAAPAVETASLAAYVETPVVEAPPMEGPLTEEVVVEEPPFGDEVVVEEPPFVEEVVVEEPPMLEAPVAEVSLVDEEIASVAPAATDDLKARIEETRRRIRQELEQPFISGVQSTAAAADDWTVSPAVQLVEPDTAPPPVVQELVDASLPTEEYAAEESVFDEPVDYDSMRSRIEDVRSRLKAKAFDAMMSGEAALLGRDAEGARPPKVVPDVDSDVDETIESSLREEDN